MRSSGRLHVAGETNGANGLRGERAGAVPSAAVEGGYEKDWRPPNQSR